MSASARVPAHHLSHHLPQSNLPVSPPAAVAEEVFLRLGRCAGFAATIPPEFVILWVAELFQVDSSRCMPGLLFVELGSQILHACHPNRSLGPHLALASVADVLGALVRLQLRLGS